MGREWITVPPCCPVPCGTLFEKGVDDTPVVEYARSLQLSSPSETMNVLGRLLAQTGIVLSLITLSGNIVAATGPSGAQVAMERIVFRVESGMTAVTSDKRSIFVDYRDSVIVILLHSDKSCQRYSYASHLSAPKTMDDGKGFIAQRSILFEQIDVLHGATRADGLRQVTVIFGSAAMRLRTVKTPQIRRYGLDFKPGRVDFLIDVHHALADQLKAVAQSNSTVYETAPLLKQVDLVGLLPVLGGVPVQMVHDERVIDLQFNLAAEGSVRSELQIECH